MEKDVNGNIIRVPKIIDMHLNAAYKAAADKMMIDIEIMRCQVNDIVGGAAQNITELNDWERGIVFASLSEMRKNVNSIQNQIDDLSIKTKAWLSATLTHNPEAAKPIYPKKK